MKTNKIRKVAFLAGMAAILMYIAPACNKEKHEEQLAIHPEGEFMNDDDLVNKVLDFSQMATNLKEGKMHKSGEKMLIDDAIYYISATLNYIYCNHTATYGKMHLDTVNINLPVIATEGKAYLVDALEGYNTAVENLRSFYNNIGNSNKNLLGCMITKGIVQNNTINMSIIAQLGVGPAQPLVPLHEDLQYWWERDSYDCDFNGNEGAPNIIENRVMFGFCPAPPPNCRYWFPQIFVTTFNATDYEVDQIHDNWCDYKIFYVSGTPAVVYTHEVQCLGTDPVNHPNENELNFYYNGLREVISQSLIPNLCD
jgi:hypothetical protein